MIDEEAPDFRREMESMPSALRTLLQHRGPGSGHALVERAAEFLEWLIQDNAKLESLILAFDRAGARPQATAREAVSQMDAPLRYSADAEDSRKTLEMVRKRHARLAK